MDLESLCKEFKVEYEVNPAYLRTRTKEKVGEKFIKKYNIWEELFPDYQSIKKVTTKKLQLDGVDYILTDANGDDIYIDIKCDIGYDYEDIVPLEIRQKGIFTMLSFKKTDYILHIVIDDHQRKAVLIDYQLLSKIANKISKAQIAEKKHLGQLQTVPFEVFESFNKTGEYVRLPYKNIKHTEVKIF